MDAWRFFAGMFGALLVFATTTFVVTGSFGTTLVETIAAAVLLQIGYFVCIAVLVRRAAAAGRHHPSDEADQKGRDPASRRSTPALKRPGTIG